MRTEVFLTWRRMTRQMRNADDGDLVGDHRLLLKISRFLKRRFHAPMTTKSSKRQAANRLVRRLAFFDGDGGSRTRVRRVRPQTPTSLVVSQFSRSGRSQATEPVPEPADGSLAARIGVWTTARRLNRRPHRSTGVRPDRTSLRVTQRERVDARQLVVLPLFYEVGAPRLAVRDQPSPSKPFHPRAGQIIA